MMTKNCDVYIKKAKLGAIVFSTIIIIGFFKKTNLIDVIFDSNVDYILITWVLIAFVISLKLAMPYIACLSKHKKL